MPARSEKIWTQARTAADHLPELGLRPHRLEEYKVDDLRHVDAGIQHIDRNGDMWRLVRVVQTIDERLRVTVFRDDHAREVAGKMRIIRIEARADKFGMSAVFGEDNGLPEPVAVLDLDPVSHQVLEHAVDGVRVEQPLVERRRLDNARNGTAIVPLQRVPRLLLFIGELVVADAAVEEVGGE